MDEKKRVLIISYYFAPQNTMGAVRPTKLAKYLQRMGHEVTVICGTGMDGRQDPTLAKDMAELKDVRILDTFNPLRRLKQHRESAQSKEVSTPAKADAAPQAERSGLKQRVADALYLFLWVVSDWCFEHRGKQELNKLDGIYDAVFSSYAPMSSHEIASAAVTRGLAKHWVADFRDEMGVSFRWQEPRKRRLWRRLKKAEELTAVSQGMLDVMGIGQCGQVLSNGFDREDCDGLSPSPRDGFFRAVYCGQLNMGRKGVPDRDLTPIFAGLQHLIAQEVLDKAKLKLCYAGGEGDTFLRYAKSCGLEDCVTMYGSVSREGSLKLQSQADLLLMASRSVPGQSSILTGKLYEYMMIGKPIACVIGGDVIGSELKAQLEQTGAGFAAEEGAGQADIQKLESYLYAVILRWQRGELPLEPKCKDEVDAFSYPRLAQMLAGMLRLD